jgi:hypothetical protein
MAMPSYVQLMSILPDNVLDSSGIWLSVNGRYGRVGGKVNWDRNAPALVEFLTGWPVLSFRLVQGARRTQTQTTMQMRKSSWHAHLPRERLGVPTRFRISAGASRGCLRIDGDAYIFDFTGMSPRPQGDALRRAAVLLEEIENFRRYNPEVFERLGVRIEVRFQDDSE